MGAYNDMVKVYESADPDKPDDPKVDAQAEAIAKKNGFASLAEFDDVSVSISADKTVPDAEKKDDLAELEAALKIAKPIQFKENIALVLKYYDKLFPLMQEPGRG
jgi:hypothetical protein